MVSVPEPPDDVRPVLPADADPADMERIQDEYESALSDLLETWPGIEQAQKDSILTQLEFVAGHGDPLELLAITVDTIDASGALLDAMTQLWRVAAAGVIDEASSQGLSEGDILAAPVDKYACASSAQVYADQLSRYMLGSAIGEAMRIGLSGLATDVRTGVGEHLDTLTDAYPRLVLGGALTQAQRGGRVATMMAGPEVALYADEVLDKVTCKPCRTINRRWIGNSSTPMPLSTYPVAGYINCEGRWRCRGQVVAVWRGGDDASRWIELPPQRS